MLIEVVEEKKGMSIKPANRKAGTNAGSELKSNSILTIVLILVSSISTLLFPVPSIKKMIEKLSLNPILTAFHHHLMRWPELCLAAICLFLSIIWYLKNKNDHYMQWPIVGVLPSIIKNVHRVHDWSVENCQAFGCTIQAKGPIFCRWELLFTCDPRNVEYILKTNVTNFPKGEDYLEAFDVLGDGLFNVDSELWQIQRSMARKAFASNGFRGTMCRLSKKLVEEGLVPLLSNAARESSVVDLQDIFMRFTFDIIIIAIFGRDSKSLSAGFKDNELANSLDAVLDGIFSRHVSPRIWWKLCRLLGIGEERKLAKAWKTIDIHMAHYISLKKAEAIAGSEEADLMATYVNFQKESKDFSSNDKFLRDTALTFILAGRDTTGTTLTWFFYTLSKNPHAEAKILEELKKVSRKDSNVEQNSPWVFNSEDLKSLVYLHAALCEAMRLYPSPSLNRKGVLKEDVLPNGTVVKPGMMVITSAYAMARMECVWGKDCSEFKPERWIDEHGKLSPEPLTKFFTFGAGPRICLGKEMGFTVMKAAVAAVLFNFQVEVIEGQTICPKPSLVLSMKNGLMVKIKERVS
ncbi:Cytochrome p450 [Thalictrum thalictroides]|uniref:Cytochrome p450 n=1 Tax=Thalictrum thalictroides TaxID=46969 RepID=A0A7J6X7T2_THATH|nr:Cytochrome p450 [Thalictrum thalictroides]